MSDALLIKALEANESSDLIWIVLMIIGVWVFKEVRKDLIEFDKYNSDKIDKALLVYGELEVLLILYLNDNTIDFVQKISNAYPYFGKKLIKDAYNLIESPDQENVKSFLLLLRDEIMRLKSLQVDPVAVRLNGSFLDEIINYFNKTKFNSFIQSIFFVIIIYVLICFITLIIVTTQTADLYGKFILMVFPVVAVLNVLLFITFIDKVFFKKFIHNFKNWIAFGVLVLVPVFIFLYTRYRWLILLDFITVLAYMTMFHKDSIRAEED